MLAGRRLVFTIILGLSLAASQGAPDASAQSLPQVPQSLLDQLQRQQGPSNGEITVQQPLPMEQNRGTQSGQQGAYGQQNGYGNSQQSMQNGLGQRFPGELQPQE